MRYLLLSSALVCFTALHAVETLAQSDRGFVSGVGVGVAPISRFTCDGVSESAVALAFSFSLGYGWDERNVLVVEGIIGRRRSEYYTREGENRTHLDGSPLGNQYVMQTFGGPVWHHYFRSSSKSFFSSVGVGFYEFRADDFGKNGRGLGWLVGGGYQFTEYLQAQTCVTFGSSSDYSATFHHFQMSCLLSVLPPL